LISAGYRISLPDIRPDQVRPDTGYPANVGLILLFLNFFLQKSCGKEVGNEIILVNRKCFALRLERIVILKITIIIALS
jgi:hypothetical protein